MSDYARMWMLLQAPQWALVALWAALSVQRSARWVWAAGALVSLAWLGPELLEVLDGGLPREHDELGAQIPWVVLGGLLAVSAPGKERFHLHSGALGAAYLGLGAWIPGVVMLGLGRAESASNALRAALWAQLAVAAVTIYGRLEVWSYLAFLGLSADETSILTDWSLGAAAIVCWMAVAAALRAGQSTTTSTDIEPRSTTKLPLAP